MKLRHRLYDSDDDFWRLRDFLRQTLILNNGHQHNWHVVRFDYWRWHGIENCHACEPIDGVTHLWETAEGKIAAAVHPEDRGHAFFEVHPGWRTAALESEMLDVAENRLAATNAAGRRELTVWAHADDTLRIDLLQSRGYQKGDWPEYQRRRSMNGAVAPVSVPEGYTVRPLGLDDELPRRSWVSWRAFHPDEPDSKYEGWTWYHNVQRAPLYRRDLDIVAVAPEGEFAAFCTGWFDDVTRTGVMEPVGTAPEHQRRGLGRAVMNEALRRLKLLGATTAYVGSYSEAAGALYASVGFREYDLLELWHRQW